MTNLLISYPDLPAFAVNIFSPFTYSTSRPKENMISGPRGKLVELSVGTNEAYMVFDMGVGFTGSIDHLILSRADILKAQGCDNFHVDGSGDNVNWTPLLGTNGTFQTRVMDGPQKQDIIFLPGYNSDYGISSLPSSAYRFLRIVFGKLTGSTKWRFSTVHFGRFFDFGVDPDYQTSRSALYYSNTQRTPVNTFEFKWLGVTAAKKSLFHDRIYQHADVYPVFLYTQSYHKILNDFRIFHCKISSASYALRIPGYYDVSVSFEELV